MGDAKNLFSVGDQKVMNGSFVIHASLYRQPIISAPAAFGAVSIGCHSLIVPSHELKVEKMAPVAGIEPAVRHKEHRGSLEIPTLLALRVRSDPSPGYSFAEANLRDGAFQRRSENSMISIGTPRLAWLETCNCVLIVRRISRD